MTGPAHPDAKGLALGISAYALWGVLPLYLHLLKGVPALQVLAHRVLWSLLLLAVIVIVLRKGSAILAAGRQRRTLLLLVASAGLIAINWTVYIWSVQNDHVLEASLGYFINPLVNVALGVAILGERLRRVQGVAIGIAAIGVLVLAFDGGGSLWIPLTLAASFGLYGLVRKVVAIDALGGLTVETLLLAPACALWLIYAASTGEVRSAMRAISTRCWSSPAQSPPRRSCCSLRPRGVCPTRRWACSNISRPRSSFSRRSCCSTSRSIRCTS